MSVERFEIFKSQDLQNGYFDISFMIDGRQIYAHKLMLASISDIFKRMISDVWNNPGEPIKIETYSYNIFYEFLTFIYSGKCKLDNENIFIMVDLSEFYHVKSLQQKCDEYLSQKEYNAENIRLFFEELLKYFKSLPLFVKAIFAAIKNNHPNFVEFEIQLIRFENRFATEEKIFKKIFHWAEHQAIAKRDELNDENFNFNDAIKSEIAPFLPYIEFRKMKLCFLHTFVVKKGFIFSYDELSDILENSKGNFKVKITNENNQILSCILPRDSNSIKDIISLKFSQAVNGFPNNWLYWEETTFKYPSIPSQLKKRDDIEWYLVYYKDGRLGIRSPSLIDEDFYLIAEMSAETSAFELSEKCVIEVE